MPLVRPKSDEKETDCFVDVRKRIPTKDELSDRLKRIPPKYRWGFLLFWILWKFVALFAVIYIFHSDSLFTLNNGLLHSSENPKQRILYIVTSLAEYNNGRRSTRKDQDRLAEVVMPVVQTNIESLVKEYTVDLYFVLAYDLRPERQEFIEKLIPEGVGFEVWDNACPLGYDNNSKDRLHDNTRSLARQHRYVIKDKLLEYDFFMAFEDDMRITKHHVQQYLAVSDKIDQLRAEAPQELPNLIPEPTDPLQQRFEGPMTRDQLDRLMPGFVRVEVILNKTSTHSQRKLDPVISDHEWNGPYQFDPKPCCHVSLNPNPDALPATPSLEDVVVWETTIEPMSVRQLPQISSHQEKSSDWIVLLPGPGKRLSPDLAIGGYWSGRQGAYPEKVSTAKPYFLAQQGGWMATREQIIRWNTEVCTGSLLPPFDKPDYSEDGQASFNVEFWSGGYQLFTGIKSGCNLQRIVDLDAPSSHFIYHVANNKQRQLAQERLVKANDLVGQWNAVRKMAVDEHSKKVMPART